MLKKTLIIPYSSDEGISTFRKSHSDLMLAMVFRASAREMVVNGNGMDLAVISAKDGYVPVEQSEIAALLKK